MIWTDRYRDRVNAANLARQAKPVQAKVQEILDMLEDCRKYAYWAIEGEEAPGHWEDRLIEHAHAMVDLSHEFKAALAANPAPKAPEENGEEDLQSTR